MKTKLRYGTDTKDDAAMVREIGGVWLALQRYEPVQKTVGPFKISIHEALDNEILERYDWVSLELVRKEVQRKFNRKAGEN